MSDALDFAQKPTLLVVDDAAPNLQLIHALLKDDYRLKIANRGEAALKIASTLPVPDLILLDVLMPDLNGYEVCKRLKDNHLTADIPVIFLTGKTAVEDEEKGFAAGAVDYIAKPISPPILKARVRTHLMLKGARDYLKDQNAYLEAELERRLNERERTRKPDA